MLLLDLIDRITDVITDRINIVLSLIDRISHGFARSFGYVRDFVSL